MSVDEGVRRSYLPGSWFGIFGETAAVLLPPSEKRRVAALWELLDDGAGFDEVLDALLATGLRDLPGFLLVSDTEGSTRVVVRGAARARFESAEGVVEVDAGGAGTWLERTVTGVTATVLDVSEASAEHDDPGTDRGAPMTLVGGLVRVSRVETPVPEPAGAGPAAASDVSDAAGSPVVAPVLTGVDAPANEPPAEPVEPLAEPVAESALVPEVEPAPSADEGEATQMMSLDELTDEPAGRPDEEPAVEASLPGDPLTDGSWGEPEAPAPVPDAGDSAAGSAAGGGAPVPGGWSPAPPAPPGAVPPAAPDFGNGPAPERPSWTPEAPPANPFGPGPEQPPAEQPQPEQGWGQPEPQLPPDQQSQPEQQGWGQPEQQGWGQPEQQLQPEQQGWGQPAYGDPADAPGPVDPADHDGNTAGGGYEADVYAHPQPGIPGQPPAPSVTSRPVARLMLSHGEQIEVDRAIVIGRAPEARRFTASDQPRLVTVPSPNQEISSTHLEVRPGAGADHGSAVVTDMGSTNGTVLVQPGLPPEDLQPGIAVQLIPGAVIDLGDGLTIQVANP